MMLNVTILLQMVTDLMAQIMNETDFSATYSDRISHLIVLDRGIIVFYTESNENHICKHICVYEC